MGRTAKNSYNDTLLLPADGVNLIPEIHTATLSCAENSVDYSSHRQDRVGRLSNLNSIEVDY